MHYSVFNIKSNQPLIQPMFLGDSVNVSRFDAQRYEVFERLIERQLSFFWRPEEIDLTKDRSDFLSLSPGEQKIFILNLQYQTLLDSIQGRSPNLAFLPIVSLPELETWIEVWSFSETIHSRSYSHIMQNLFPNPSDILDQIVHDKEILNRARSISSYYDRLIQLNGRYMLFGYKGKLNPDGVDGDEIRKALYLALVAVNVLEALRFYVSFACSFSFAERQLMEGNAKIIRLIARDEALHLSGTQHIINLLHSDRSDPKMHQIAHSLKDETYAIFKQAVKEEKRWAHYLFKHGSMVGLNEQILSSYIEYLTDIRLKALNMKPIFNIKNNPIPWINDWLKSDHVQVAPQESEITSYLVGAVDASLDEDLSDLDCRI